MNRPRLSSLTLAGAELLWSVGDLIGIAADVLESIGGAVRESGHQLLDAYQRAAER
jgi:hypothetical protein